MICLHNTPATYVKIPTYAAPTKDIDGIFYCFMRFYSLNVLVLSVVLTLHKKEISVRTLKLMASLYSTRITQRSTLLQRIHRNFRT